MPSTTNVERLLSLALTLSSTRRGLSRDEILALVPGYGTGAAVTRRRQFVRDLSRLDRLGLDIRKDAHPMEPNTPRYRIERTEGHAHTLNPAPDERAVLAAAAAMWSSERGAGIGARVRAKLASVGIPSNVPGPHGSLGTSPAFGPLLEAKADGRAVRFSYRAAPAREATERTLEPWSVGLHGGREYVYGWDRLREAPRLFRVSRIESTPVDDGPARQVRDPAATVAHAFAAARQADENDAGRLLARVEPFKALTLRELCDARPDAPSFEVPSNSRSAVLELALSEPLWVRLEGNSPIAEEWASIRQTIATLHAGPAEVTVEQIDSLPTLKRSKAREVVSSDDELTRLSAEIAFVHARGEVELHEMAEHFGIDEEQLVRDLRVLYMSGDYSTGLDDLVDARWDGGTVSIRGADVLATPLSFSPAEASALLLGLEALEGVNTGLPEEAVTNVRTLLTGILGVEQLRTSSLETARGGGSVANDGKAGETSHSDLSSQMLDAWRESRARRIVYSAPDRHGVSVRDIVPLGLLSMYGTTYIEAECSLARGVREFRADRIVSEYDPDDEHAPAPGDESAPTVITRSPNWKAVTISVREGAHWVLEAFEATSPKVDRDAGVTYARVSTDAPHALVSAVFETQGGIEIVAPPDIRDVIHNVAVAQGPAG